ncbi:MAG: RdgB/HAM1 family non-canonical purine NTP pyrophosphatase [Woeseia sp.]|nr:RdgB/HAM1 family non-canonical purine NTP pyrophosphatase [Woeseia sp.]MBT8096608.1 RdgB/HAM1 family non-canonical purine NTP pyrophosphatase [Woeseia sp.]NNE60711.1 RdgB/HAM1 family non-canonical purine NTP pyrophosphatase [Woeseia sp.]NNL54713.1 RdgB/HAM1 family non-canonical purine NTP pyrophosphatase [Woeseia sp.]
MKSHATARRLVLASGNRGKLAEIQALLAPLGAEVCAQSEFDVPEAVEDGDTFVANALIKARHAAALTGLPAIADDSGLTVDALGGAPGVLSARYAGEQASDAENVDKLLAALDGVPQAARAAAFHCAAVFVAAADDSAPLIEEGLWRGRILETRHGTGGFGYDPVFFDESAGCAAAEMTQAQKNGRSHRGLAFRALCAELAERWA